ncbi:MAG TPA: prephenate dehydrogenase/arogenate dehydrogenase family protein [Dissulfurispiraceae bacterium]|nr:prephenate dehydrogenase/arogenate dehydrogenase family protein [Dissulfurispiraceae bacterium]
MGLYFDRAAIIGVGLIGASIALALREKGLCGTIIGCGRKEENLKKAKQQEIINDYLLDPAQAADGADLVILCTPVGTLKNIAAGISHALKKGSLVTDVGSVKGRMVFEIEEIMPKGVHFVGSHPIAGSEKAGIEDARGSLFAGARCIVTPTSSSNKEAVQELILLWQTVGGAVEIMDPLRHDEIFSLISHMPHVVAYALVNAVESIDQQYIKYSGGGFRDTTRIAASSPELWRDICMMNRDNICKVLDLFKENLQKIERCMTDGDWEGVEREFARAQKLRMRI